MARSSGTSPGERRLNGPQTPGREYANLSAAEYAVRSELDVAIPARDGVRLLADVFRPDAAGRHPALVAFSPYPRQIQHSGLPMGFVEAGATDFFVPRGYGHVIVNARGTCGSDGTYTFLDEQEGRDLYDVIEWVAAQPWCDGNVGMIGISYFAMAQLVAAAQRPPHLKAIFPFAVTVDWYRGVACQGGMPSAKFLTNWLSAVGTLAGKGNDFFRGPVAKVVEAVMRSPVVHSRVERFEGEAAAFTLGKVMPSAHAPHPWDDLIRAVTFEHPLYDDFWRTRTWLGVLRELDIPIYLGCAWDNVPVHLASTFRAWDAVPESTSRRMTLLPRGGMSWPWESLHVEALAWYDRWLKGRPTGIDDGDPIRYWLEGAGEWRSARAWPLPEASHVALHLRADGRLDADEGAPGDREYLYVSPLQPKPRGENPAPWPSRLSWETAPLQAPMDVAGEIEVELVAATTAVDADWIVKLQVVAPDGAEVTLTEGWLRASHRAVDADRSRVGAPFHPHDRVEPVTPGRPTTYRIAVVPTAHRVGVGSRLRLLLTSSDAGDFAMQGMEHVPQSGAARHRVLSSSRLLLPVLS